MLWEIIDNMIDRHILYAKNILKAGQDVFFNVVI